MLNETLLERLKFKTCVHKTGKWISRLFRSPLWRVDAVATQLEPLLSFREIQVCYSPQHWQMVGFSISMTECLRLNWEYLRFFLWLFEFLHVMKEYYLLVKKYKTKIHPLYYYLKVWQTSNKQTKKSLHETNNSNFVKPLVGSHFSYTTIRDRMIVSPTPHHFFSQRSKSKMKRKIPESTWNTR